MQDVNKKSNLHEKNNVNKLRAMFEGMSVGETADKLKTQVKGYSVKAITEGMLKKHKLGDAMAAICDMKELEEEIRESVKSGLPVYGFFREKKMWSCFLFDKVDISRNELSPEPESGNDTLCIYRLRKSYVHPDAEGAREDMAEVAHSNVYQKVIDVFDDGKSDGFIWKDKVYVCKKDKVTGIPYGLIVGIALGLVYGMLFDNLALGISIGFCFGISFSMIWGTSTHKYAEHGMAEKTESKDADSITDGTVSEDADNTADEAGSEDADSITDGAGSEDADNTTDGAKSADDNNTDE